ncbi:MAG: hypothetical protein JWR84_884 [Caulobacter sp.]|nr:hypothetical protein [Caulobacter sp.]
MRALMLATALLAFPMAAQAASPKLIDEYMAICAPTQANPTAAIAAAKARGFAEVTIAKPEGVDTMVAMTKQVDGQTWAAVVGTFATAKAGDTPGQNMSSCSITGVDIGTTSADAARRWAGMPAASMGEAKTAYFFYERNGKRTAIASGDEAATLAALKGGGYALLQIEQAEGKTGVTVTNAKPIF